jgi:phasin family protein
MTEPSVKSVANANSDAVAKTAKLGEHMAEAGTAKAAKSVETAKILVEGNADALAKSGKASTAALQQLTTAYQELAAKNVKTMTSALQALAAVKTPTEFMELQQRLIKDSMEAAIHDSQHIAQLTSAVFTTAFEPVKRQLEAVQKRVTR